MSVYNKLVLVSFRVPAAPESWSKYTTCRNKTLVYPGKPDIAPLAALSLDNHMHCSRLVRLSWEAILNEFILCIETNFQLGSVVAC